MHTERERERENIIQISLFFCDLQTRKTIYKREREKEERSMQVMFLYTAILK